MASSSTSFTHKSYKYDVFLSFSGEDTRKTFVDHLYVALEQQGIHTFKDDEKLNKGISIDDELLESIKNSKIYIIVFSKSYASSSWCLNELVTIMECQRTNEQTAYPVFYDVDPSEVRNQHGWHEAKVIKLIVECVSLELRFTNTNVDEKLIGMEQRMQDLESFLEIGSNDVRMIRVKGMGGAGKTTLARAIVDKVSFHFEAKSFIEHVSEVSKASLYRLLSLQWQVLSDLLKDQGNNIHNVHEGRNMMKKMMCGRKVIVVLDDVDHKDQLEALAGEANWFKSGSRIIITTRDDQVLIAHGVKLIWDVSLLSDEEAIRLFSKHAFGRDVPTESYEMQSQEVVCYAAGLPLTIKVLGSFLCGKNKLDWMDVLERLKTIPLKETLEKLELSYTSLEDDYKEIFLDVTCFLKGWEKNKAIKLLESCGFHARTALKVLEQKSLIMTTKAFDAEFIDIHNHIEEMGRNIVRRLHPDEPNTHSRLWVQEEIEDVLANNLVRTRFTPKVIIKLLKFSLVMTNFMLVILECQGAESTRYIDKKLTTDVVLEGLGNMKKLRCLIVDYRNYNNDCVDRVKLNEINQYLPNALKYLNWFRYPHWCFPKTFQGTNLVALEMHDSKIKLLWEGGKHLESLKFLNLGYLSLREFPDIIPGHYNSSLLELDFSSNNVEELPLSMGKFHKLGSLNLNGCRKLKKFPECVSSRCLRNLHLDDYSIEECPEDTSQLGCLKLLDLSYTCIKHLPNSICNLKHLKTLRLQFCALLDNLLEDLGQLESLEELDLSFCKLRDIPRSICMVKRLETLILEGYESIKLPEELSQLKSLKKLNLRGSKIKEIPDTICNLNHLKELDLSACSELENLPENFGDLKCLEMLDVQGTSITHFPHGVSLLKGLQILGFESYD
ncbi:hypothetical protein R6Q57_015506 [Mikania cordata]